MPSSSTAPKSLAKGTFDKALAGDMAEEYLRLLRNLGPVATPSTWQVRQPMYKTSIGRWRDYEPWLGEFRALSD